MADKQTLARKTLQQRDSTFYHADPPPTHHYQESKPSNDDEYYFEKEKKSNENNITNNNNYSIINNNNKSINKVSPAETTATEKEDPDWLLVDEDAEYVGGMQARDEVGRMNANLSFYFVYFFFFLFFFVFFFFFIRFEQQDLTASQGNKLFFQKLRSNISLPKLYVEKREIERRYGIRIYNSKNDILCIHYIFNIHISISILLLISLKEQRVRKRLYRHCRGVRNLPIC